jgi:hypothetical protein
MQSDSIIVKTSIGSDIFPYRRFEAAYGNATNGNGTTKMAREIFERCASGARLTRHLIEPIVDSQNYDLSLVLGRATLTQEQVDTLKKDDLVWFSLHSWFKHGIGQAKITKVHTGIHMLVPKNKNAKGWQGLNGYEYVPIVKNWSLLLAGPGTYLTNVGPSYTDQRIWVTED